MWIFSSYSLASGFQTFINIQKFNSSCGDSTSKHQHADMIKNIKTALQFPFLPGWHTLYKTWNREVIFSTYIPWQAGFGLLSTIRPLTGIWQTDLPSTCPTTSEVLHWSERNQRVRDLSTNILLITSLKLHFA